MKISNINFNLYKTFIEVYDAKSMSDAAVKLGLTQPTVSHNVKELDKQLGTQLFYTNSRGVEPTSNAHRLYAHIKKAFVELISGEEALKQFNEVKMSLTPYYADKIMTDFIADFSKRNPNIRIEAYRKFTAEAIDALNKYETDFAITQIESLPNKNSSPKTIVLKHLKNTLFASKEFARKHRIEQGLTKKQLNGLPIISLTNSFAIRGHLAELGIITSNPLVEVESKEMMNCFVSQGMGIGYCVDEFFGSESENIIKIPLLDAEMPKFYFVCQYQENLANKAALAFIAELEKQFC